MSTTPSPPSVLTAVRWSELFPWLILVRAARVALMARVIALAVVGVIATQWGWAAISRLVLSLPAERAMVRLSDDPPPRLWETRPAPAAAATLSLPDPNAAIVRPPLIGAEYSDLRRVATERLNWSHLFERLDSYRYAGPALRGWAWAMQPFARLVDAAGWRQWIGFILAGLWTIAVWALFGGAISRIAALYLTRGETLGPLAALGSAVRQWPATAGAPAFCLVIISVLALMLAAIGLAIRFGPFALLAGLCWALVLLAGVVVALVAIGLLVGWPLMWATAATERTDAFDAVSRGYSYVYQRPLHLVFFLLVTTVLGLLAQATVSVFTDASIKAAHWGIAAGAGDQRMRELFETPISGQKSDPPGMLVWAGGKTMRFWTIAALAIAASFPMAYLWPAATGIYLLLRELIDSTDLGESSYDAEFPAEGLPPLATDSATSVPHVDRPTESNGA